MAKKKKVIIEQHDYDDIPVHMMYGGVITGILTYLINDGISYSSIKGAVQGAGLAIPHALFRHIWVETKMDSPRCKVTISKLLYITSVGAAIGSVTAAFLSADALEGAPDYKKAITGAMTGGWLAAANCLLHCSKTQYARILGCVGLGLLGWELFALEGVTLAISAIYANKIIHLPIEEKLLTTSFISIGCICTENVKGGFIGIGVIIGYALLTKYANNVDQISDIGR